MRNLIFVLFLVPVMGLFVSCTNMFYQPDHYLHFPPERLNLLYENRMFPSSDGTRLHSWFFPQQIEGKKLTTPKKGLVVLFHGNAENLSSHYVSVAWLTQHGYDVWVWDYRGYGLSQGEADLDGVYLDSLAALKYAHDLREKESYPQLVTVGQSLGGNILMRALKDDPKAKEITLVVIDSSFLSYEKIAKTTAKSVWVLYPLSFFAPLLISEKYSPEPFIGTYPYPVVVMHSKSDKVIPFSFGEEIYEKWGGPKKFWVSEKAPHIEALSNPKRGIQEKLLSILQKLQEGSSSF